MGSMKSRYLVVWVMAGLIATIIAAGGIMLADGPVEPPEKKVGVPKAGVQPVAANEESSTWQEKTLIEIPGWLPVSAAYSFDGKTIVVGGTSGKVIAYEAATHKEKWKADVGGNFAAVAFSADGRSVLATFRDGVRFLDAETGKAGDTIEESGALDDWRMMAVGVFPDTAVDVGMKKVIRHKIIMGTSFGYVIKTWLDSGVPGTIKTSTPGKDNKIADANAIPLAVDPAGTSVIITGPIDRATGKNILWAYVAGNNDKDSPGNRVLEGHNARVVSAAWSKDGKTAVTGDSDGRVIVWDGKTMKETGRVELGQRIAAVAVTSDGRQIAAAAVGKKADFYVWETAKPANNLKPIHSDAYDYQSSVFACLAFSPNNRQLAGCAIEEVWLSRLGKLVGKLHIWEMADPKPEEKPPEPQPVANLKWTAEKPISDPQFDVPSLAVRSVAVSPDGKKFSVGADNGMNTIVFDAATGTKLFVVSGQGARFVGKDIHTWNSSANQFDADTGTLREMFPPATKGAWLFGSGAQFSPNGKTIAGFDCGVLRLVDARTGADAVSLTGPKKQFRNRIPNTPLTFSTNEVCWSRDGNRVAGLDLDWEKGGPSWIGGLAIWDAQTGKQLVSRQITVAEPSARTMCFGFSPDGKTLAVCGLTTDKRGASSLAILDAETLKTIRSTPIDSRDGGADVTAVAFSPDGGTIAIAVNLHSGKSPLNRIQHWDVAAGELHDTLLPKDHDTPPIASLEFAPDGKTLIAATGSLLQEQQKEVLHRILIWRGEPKSK